MHKNTTIVGGLGALILVVGAYLYYDTSISLSYTKAELSVASSTVATLSADLSKAEAENAQLADALAAEKERNDAFEDRIGEISGTVGKLDKLAKTDPELLQKYSKIYFLNENYIPSGLTQIPTDWTYGAQEEYFHRQAWPYLEDLLRAAEEDGVDLRVVSAYRSFETQAILKGSYTVRYGSGANAFSADQGYSEHQLGTTLDFTTETLGAGWTNSFDSSPGFSWLEDNAYKYGFILSYPKGNAYYVYEPWHWRYVGEGLARELHEDGKVFYDLDQRTLDEYLIEFFD
jgi:LAS superfamily LD-carboxypeptidase LdcB